MNIKHLIGKRIKELRKRKNLTQEDLSELVNLSQNAMSYIETGENFFSSETLEKLLVALDVEPEELFQFGHLQDDSNLMQEIIFMLNKRPDKISEVYKIVKAITL